MVFSRVTMDTRVGRGGRGDGNTYRGRGHGNSRGGTRGGQIGDYYQSEMVSDLTKKVA